MNNIAELHEKVYAYLIENHPDLTFSLSQDNRDGMLEKGYWFEGDEGNVCLTFWKNKENQHNPIFLRIRTEHIPTITLCCDYSNKDGESVKKIIEQLNRNLYINDNNKQYCEYLNLYD